MIAYKCDLCNAYYDDNSKTSLKIQPNRKVMELPSEERYQQFEVIVDIMCDAQPSHLCDDCKGILVGNFIEITLEKKI